MGAAPIAAPCPAPLLLSLCAPAMGSGKTTLAEYLEFEHGFQIVRFASGLKAMTQALFENIGLSAYDARELIGDPELKELPLRELGGATPRYLMQTLGTEWGRNVHGDDFWVNLTMTKVKRLMAEGHSVVIDDCRFTNEADAVIDAGGRMIRIVRPGIKVAEGKRHVSEGELDAYPCFATLLNDGRPEKLYRNADSTLNVIRAIQSY